VRLSPVVLLLGPSGAGKSTLRSWLAEDLRLLDLELDAFETGGGDGVDRAGLRAPWDALYKGHDPEPLGLEMRRRAAAARTGAHWDRNAWSNAAFESSEYFPFKLWTFGQRGRVLRQVLVEKVASRIMARSPLGKPNP